MDAVAGAGLPATACLAPACDPEAPWTLAGVPSNLRYTTELERSILSPASSPLGRGYADRAVLIPIRKSDAWWAMAQDERRAIYARSGHMAIGMDYMPAVARALFHSRDLGQPFDFLTWFEFAAPDALAFETMVARLRATEEWTFVEREVEIWLERDAAWQPPGLWH